MAKRRKVGNLLALALLALLAPGRPMHPYEMAIVLRKTGKERDMRIKWGSLYTVVANMEKHGFIEATGSDRDGRRPERTVYAITDAGRDELRDWLRELVAVPEPEVPRFEAALSVISVLGPDEAVDLLRRRLAALEESIRADREELAGYPVPRLFLLEGEFALAMREAEAAWVRRLIEDLAEGGMPEVDQWREFHRTGRMPPELTAQWNSLFGEGGPPDE